MNIAIPKGNGEFHLFSNEDLKKGDKVYPLVHTYHRSGKLYVTGMAFNMDDTDSTAAVTGWPYDPHTVESFYLEEGLWWVHTDKGYSPAQAYFKLLTPMPDAVTRKDVMPYVDGKHFHCDCGGNVFSEYSDRPGVYVCNSCSNRYRGELKKETGGADCGRCVSSATCQMKHYKGENGGCTFYKEKN